MRDELTSQRDELDILVDAALSTYVDVEARPGLTQRILAVTTHLEPRRSPFSWLPWAVPALAVLVLIAAFLVNRSPAPHPTSAVAAHPSIPGAPPAIAAVKTPPQLRPRLPRPISRAVSTTSNPLPRLEVFPTPTALSPEEQALVGLVNRNPQEVAQSTSRDQQQPTEPIHIAVIEIPPLNPPDNGSN